MISAHVEWSRQTTLPKRRPRAHNVPLARTPGCGLPCLFTPSALSLSRSTTGSTSTARARPRLASGRSNDPTTSRAAADLLQVGHLLEEEGTRPSSIPAQV